MVNPPCPRRPLAIITAITLAPPLPLHALAPQDAPPVPSCPDCRFAFDAVAVLGSSDGDGAIRSGPSGIARDAQGRFIVAQRVANESAMVFGPDGGFLTTIGRVGDGPGEYRRIRALSVVGEALYLYDEQTQRISIVDRDLEFQGSIPLRGGGVWGAVALRPDLHAVNMIVPGGSSTGRAIHLVNGEGEIVRSVERFDSRSGDPTAHLRHLFRDADGDGFWSVGYFGRVTLRRYSASGELLTEWSAAPSPGDDLPMTYGNPDEDRPPTRQIEAAWHDDGLIWVASWIPGPGWRDGLRRTRDDLHGSSFTPTDLGLVFDGAVEVFDADSGRLMAARYGDGPAVAEPIGRGIAASLRTDELGWVYLEVLRARLVRPESR